MAHSLLSKEEEKETSEQGVHRPTNDPYCRWQDDQMITGKSITPFASDRGVKLGQPKNTWPPWGKAKMDQYQNPLLILPLRQAQLLTLPSLWKLPGPNSLMRQAQKPLTPKRPLLLLTPPDPLPLLF